MPDIRKHRAARARRERSGRRAGTAAKTARRSAADALRRSEERLQSLIDLSDQWYWEQDEHHRFTLILGARVGPSGTDLRRFLGTTRWEQEDAAVPVDDGGSWESHKAALAARQPFADFVIRRIDPQGALRYVSISGQPVFERKRFTGYRGIAKDITASMRADQLLRLEHMVARSVASADSAAAALKEVIRAVCETQGWECGRYWRVDEAAGVLRFAEFWCVPHPVIERFIAGKRDAVFGPGVGLAGRAWQSGEPTWVADVGEDARAQGAAVTLETGMRGAFHFPVRADGKVIGVLAFNSRRVREPDERLLQAVRVVGSQIGQYLQRREAEEALRRFRAAMDVSVDAITLIDRASMRYIDVNEAACRALGYSRKELLALGPHDIFSGTRDELAAFYDRLIQGDLSIAVARGAYRRKDGSLVPVESYRRAVRSGSGDIIVSIARDISERLAAEEALRKSNERFNLAVRATNDIVWDWDLVKDERWWNENFMVVFGYPAHEIGAGSDFWRSRIHPDDRDRVTSGMRAIIESNAASWNNEYRFQRHDATYAHVLDRGHLVRDAPGRALRMIGAMADISARKLAEERIQYLATHDGLTGLPNRIMFSQLLNVAIQTAERYGRSFAVLFVDLDRFKFVNDTLGHEAGDKLLQQMSQRFKEAVRASDVVARLGGDEFVVLVQEVSEAAQVAAVARKLLSAALKPVVVFEQECRVTASVGISLYPADARDEQALMKNADVAMYHAKEEGKNNFQFYSKDIKAQSLERLALEAALRRALERKEFSLHYQAKLDFHSGRISGVEALLRWQNPELGAIAPAQFIPLAEETGIIVPIGRWVLQEACAQNVAWQRQGLPALCVAVNLSARQFSDANFLSDVVAALEQSGMKPELLELELTESMVMRNPEQAAQLLAAVKRLGVRIAIDDFGVGYSSLAQIKRFPIDTLKVDRSFIRDLPENAEDRAITQAIIAMGKSLSLSVVAEGVETQEQQNFLRSQACDAMQGYYFSKPLPQEDFAGLLREHVAGES
jgi:diguanylate cyclase (GGDEF)-like protein/PAS domain S-box-containing protein